MSHKILSFSRLSYVIHGKDLFNSLTISFLPSSIIHIAGKNGSGKSSLLKIIASIQRPSSGEFYFDKPRAHTEQNLFTESSNKKPYCTYIGHKLGLKLELTVLENLQFWTGIYNSSETLEASIYYFALHDMLGKKCYELSEGNKQKVALSKLLSCQSDLWLLDEVDSSLDDNNKRLLYNLIISKASSGGIVFSASHGVPMKEAYVLDLDNC